jgi:hypothetical protein
MKEKGFFEIQFDEEQGAQPFSAPRLLGKPNHILKLETTYGLSKLPNLLQIIGLN